jgi:class 3 adenylate cyclase
VRIGIGLGAGDDAALAAAAAAQQANQGAPDPDLSFAFGHIRLDQAGVHRGLSGELDASRLLGGSSYAEITPAGVSSHSVAVMNISFGGPRPAVAQAGVERGAAAAGRALSRSLAGARAKRPLAFYLGAVATGQDNDALGALREGLGPVPVFGGMTCGDYDQELSHPDFFRSSQYGPRLTSTAVRAALVDLPQGGAMSFGFEHGWDPVGPPVLVTKAKRERVYEVGGVPVFEYYRQFLGSDHDYAFFEALIQRYGFSVLSKDGRSLLKLPVLCDRKRGFISYFPADDMQGARVRLILAGRNSLIAGSRAAALRCRAALGGRKPDLLFVVSCCTRKRILHSRIGEELAAIRSAFPPSTPVFGCYSGGEIAPFESREREARDPRRQGSRYHTTTVTMLALCGPQRKRVSVPAPQAVPVRIADDADAALAASENTLDAAESFLANLSRKSYEDGEKLRRQSEVLRRYTPHGVWTAVGERAAAGQYEVPDSEFKGAFLFMDVKGFTAFSETRRPAAVVAELNALLAPATEAVYARGGDVDKFIGDCIFAVFPTADAGLAAARDILALSRARRGAGSPFDVRVGLNWGRAVRANVGARGRREYTFIGDAVNLAQRMESNASPGTVLVSAEAWKRLRRRPKAARRRTVAVKGKKAPVACWELA